VTLVLALFTMVLLATTTAALLVVSASEPLIANNLLRSSQAFYVAESGLEIALATLNSDGLPLPVVVGPVGAGTYTLTVTPLGLSLPLIGPVHVRVRSVGRVGLATRAVSNEFARDLLDGGWRPLSRFREETP
jgi:hypothetical protein